MMICLSALLAPVAGAQAGRIEVAAPGGVGVVAVAADGQCSLREAVLLANGSSPVDCSTVNDNSTTLTISLPAAATFTVHSAYEQMAVENNALPIVSATYVIRGHGATIERAQGDTVEPFRLLSIASTGDLTLRDVTLSGGDLGNLGGTLHNINGGAILNAGFLTLHNCIVTGNAALGENDGPTGSNGGSGGGIYSSGTLRIEACRISNNTAGAGGDRVLGDGYSGGAGGGIFSTGLLVVLNSSVIGNVAGAGGEAGGTLGGGPPNLPGRGGNGGGIYASGPTVIKDSAIAGNHAGAGPGDGGDGGGVYLAAAAVEEVGIVRTTIAGNIVSATSLGSGLYVVGDAHVTVLASTVADNSAGSATAAGAIAVAANSVISLSYVTVSANQGGGVRIDGSGMARKSVIAAQTTGADCFGSGVLGSDHGNMDSDGSCNFTAGGDLPSGNPMLGSLWDNGGLGKTMLPQPGSPLRGAVAQASCDYNLPSQYEWRIDQRRRLRPSGGACDIGAVEVTQRCFVDAAAAPGGHGQNWASAWTDLQTALTSGCSDIRVAQGVYTPSSTGDVTASFDVLPGMALYGGFPPGGAPFEQRDPQAWPTVLSGDLGADDSNGDGDRIAEYASEIVGNNSRHVVVIDGSDRDVAAATTLDGFHITGGDANVAGSGEDGGGLYCDGNSGFCNPTLVNLVFSGNSAIGYGGALFNNGKDNGVSSPVIDSVLFLGNSAAGGSGGAVANDGHEGVSSPKLNNVTFFGNSAYVGGAVSNLGAYGISSPRLTNVTFFANAAAFVGDAMSSDGEYGGESLPRLVNVIVWGASGSIISNTHGASPRFSHSIVEGAYSGGVWNADLGIDLGGNSDTDPLLGWLGDYGGFGRTMLPTSNSPAVDAGDDSACSARDARGVARPQDEHCDIGAVERLQTVELRALGAFGMQPLTGNMFPHLLRVQALDAQGHGVQNLDVAIDTPASGATAGCHADGPTDATGIARIFCVASPDPGTYTIHLSVMGTGLTPLGVDYVITNRANDRIFGANFSGTPLPTAGSPP